MTYANEFDNVNSALEHASEIFSAANELGLLMSDAPLQSREAVQLMAKAKNWVNMVKPRLSSYSPGEALRIVDAFDMIHRIAFRQPADRKLTAGIVLRAFEAMIHGDRSVDEYAMYRTIRRGIRQGETAYFDKPLTWACLSEERWHAEAVKGFDRRKLSAFDILNRVTILLEADLFVYEGSNERRFKQRLVERYRHYLDTYDVADPRTPAALNVFRVASSPYLPADVEDIRHKHKRTKEVILHAKCANTANASTPILHA